MNKEKQILVPVLRFPEFGNDGDWEYNILSRVATFSKGKSVSKKDIVKDGKLFCIRYGELYTYYNEVIDEVISKTNLPEKGLVFSKKNDIIIPSSGETRIDIARASCVLREGIALGGDLNIIRSNINGVFLSYYINSAKKKTIAKMAQGVSVMHLYNSQLEKLAIEIPKNPKEQQKIANCLFSLDTLITAETDKLAHLKDHKKGLLQQLFPANGETKPQFRFKEFENDGDWEIKKLSNLGKLINGLTYSPKDVREKGLLVLRSSNVQNGRILLDDCVFVREDIKGANLTAPNDILICVRNGSKRLIGKNAIIHEGLPIATHGAFMTMFRANNPSFVFQLFQTESYRYQVKADLGATINSINGKNFIKYEFAVPKNPKEQQKIANCISSADAFIAAQTTKIKTLKKHKKGLMQQLFPNINKLTV
jgi:type I restriction enzyme S subunit